MYTITRRCLRPGGGGVGGTHPPTAMYDISRPGAPTYLQKCTTFRRRGGPPTYRNVRHAVVAGTHLPTEMYDGGTVTGYLPRERNATRGTFRYFHGQGGRARRERRWTLLIEVLSLYERTMDVYIF